MNDYPVVILTKEQARAEVCDQCNTATLRCDDDAPKWCCRCGAKLDSCNYVQLEIVEELK